MKVYKAIPISIFDVIMNMFYELFIYELMTEREFCNVWPTN